MDTLNVKDITKLPIGTPITALAGSVRKVFPRKCGDSQYGPWSVQGVILCDLNDPSAEISVNCWGFDDLSYLSGQTVSVAALGTSKKGGPSGAEVAQGKDKDGNARLEIKLEKKKGGFVGGDKSAHKVAQSVDSKPPETRQPMVAGVTVGMAINNAIKLAEIYQISPENLEEYLHEKASMLIRLSNKLTSNELV